MCSRGRLNTSRSSSTEWGGPRHLWVSPGLPRPRARPAVGGRRRRESRLTHRNRRIYPSPASRTTSRSAPSTWPATSRTGWLASYNLTAVPSTRDTIPMCVCRVLCRMGRNILYHYVETRPLDGRGRRPGRRPPPRVHRVTVPAAGSRTPPDSSRATLCVFACACVCIPMYLPKEINTTNQNQILSG